MSRYLSLLMALGSGACIFAPPPVDGAAQGSVCGTDLDCADGLWCECGVCSENTDTPLPPSCDVSPDDRCPDAASECFVSCGVDTVVGLADCVNGRETCEANGGVLRNSDCGPDVCWGEPDVGEVCQQGEYVCEFGRNDATGLCYTIDCDEEAAECVASCQDDESTVQECLAGAWTCEVGFPIAQCGGCVGTPPDCLNGCEGLETIAPAVCQENAWSCNHIQGAELESTCCEDALVLTNDADFVANQDVRCVTGQLLVRLQERSTLALPQLIQAGEVYVSENESTTLSLPSLQRVEGNFSIWNNAHLSSASFPELNYVGGFFEIALNPALPQCLAEALVEGIEVIEGEQILSGNDVEADCLPDAGEPEMQDAGGMRDAGDGGEAHDPGAADAGQQDAGEPVSDAGAGLDAGDGGEAADAGDAGG